MQQIASTLPAHNLHLFQARRAGFQCRESPLKPTLKPKLTTVLNRVSSSTASTRIHLSNLEKLIQKQNPPPQSDPEPVRPDPHTTSPENKGRGLLEGLNLSRLWQDSKAAEEMSPRHLNRLQRLLSMTAEYSPRNNLGSRWREYHGCNDWSGLLDPLDENLRREVVRYGEFVQAAYHAFHSNPATSAKGAPSPQHVALPDRSYRVTKSLYATSSVGLPKWVDDVAPDLGWMTQRSSWIGYVAVCDDRREIARLGRRDIVIALRGTATCLEWAENLRDLLVPLPDTEQPDQGQPKVECGFLSLHKTRGAHVPSLAESVAAEVRRLAELYEGETLSITVTGHSLGAALALLVADELSKAAPKAAEAALPPVAVFSFGGPRVGNRGFANRLNEKNVKVLRIVNSQDVITRVPGMFVDESRSNAEGGAAAAVEERMPWAYCHVGTELRVETKMSPFLKPNADVACCHDLEAYLHLVDGFLATNCPFRANAKRSLARLMNEQGSNVKKLYVKKAKALSLKPEKERGYFNMPTCLPSPS
ncbi:phospholipase A1-Ibeta2, chloroplastic [Malania oleifera]|uniref:phospholipase A1-Ibeta2, chloroplastic n=1 Tax=Malania oleifera TaxID=397392 RepID=UPI0025ADCC26|nr:phospholipase A1-Ibeta2, chloroplastic [Malania oleifera]